MRCGLSSKFFDFDHLFIIIIIIIDKPNLS